MSSITSVNSNLAVALSPSQSEGLNLYEQVTARALVSCPSNKTPILVGKQFSTMKASFFSAPCGMWSCPNCGARNARKWVARLLEGMNSVGVDDWYFVTFTAHEKWRKNTSLTNIRRNWPKLRKRMAREAAKQQFEAWQGIPYPFPAEIIYAWVYEPHNDHSWHVHLLSSIKQSTKWWKDNARQCGMGHQAKALTVKNRGMVSGYVCKYMLKAIDVYERYPKGMRRVTVSQNWPKLPERNLPTHFDEVTPLVNGQDPKRVYNILRGQGYAVSDIQKLRNEPAIRR